MNVTSILLNATPPIKQPSPTPVVVRHGGDDCSINGNLRVAFGDEKDDLNKRRRTNRLS